MSNEASPLFGRALRIRVSDPWDFVTNHGPVHVGIVERAKTGATGTIALLIALDCPMYHEGKEICAALAAPRHRDAQAYEPLLQGARIASGMIPVPREHLDAARQFDTRWHRSGGWIGTVELQ